MLTRHFKLSEFIPDDYLPPPQIEHNLFVLASELEIARRICGDRPFVVTSGVRTEQRNRAVGGVPNSRHLVGKAADIQVDGLPPSEVQAMLSHHWSLLRFEDVIAYDHHVHFELPALSWQGTALGSVDGDLFAANDAA